MKQSKITSAIALMLSLTMITSVFVGNTLSRYVTSVSSTDNARVAIWGINGEEVTMELFNTSYDLAGKTIAKSNIDGEKIIAPGTGGSSAFSIINFDQDIAPEVAYQIKIEIDDSEIDERILNNPSIQWRLNSGDWGTFDQLKTSLLSLSGDPSGLYSYAPGEFINSFKGDIEHVISWQWVLDGNNEVDTQMGIDALTGNISAKIIVKITAQQTDDLVTNAYLIDGANQVVNLNYVKPITLKSSADFGTFESVIVNGNPLTRDVDYTAESGSTVIILKTEYLSNLTVGTYTIEIVSSENTATTNFYVVNDLEDNMPMLAASDTWYKGSKSRSTVTEINLVDEASEDIINNADESWPAAVDYASDGELDDDVMCYLDGTTLTIAGNGSGKIYANYDSRNVFSDSSTAKDYFSKLEIINNAELLDTSKVNTMEKFFWNAYSLETVNLENWDTSNVTNMLLSFASSNGSNTMSFTHLDLSKWDTSNVTTMRGLFQLCTLLESLDISTWDTGNVTDMSNMFTRCQSLATLDVSNFDTSKVETVAMMFHIQDGMPVGSIDVSNWDVRNVKTFDHFVAHSKLILIGVDNWVVTSKCTNMNGMFHFSRNTTIDVSKYDTRNVTTFDQMFEGSTIQKIIGLENFNTSNAIGFSEMFRTAQIRELDLSSFDTRKAKNDIQISVNGNKSKTMYDMLLTSSSPSYSRLSKITIGPNFSFNGDGSNTKNANKCIFPTPSSTYIKNADGYWYTEDGTAYTPAEIQALPNPAGTYYAFNPVK